MPQYKLHYFNLHGLGELPRMIFHYAGVPFEDVRFERSEWPQLKANGRPVHDEQDPEKQKALMTKFASEKLIPHMTVLEAQLAKNGGVLVGKGVTWADIACYAFFNHATVKHPDILKDCPNMAAH